MSDSASSDLPNLASAGLGTKIIYATDEWFSECPNLIKDSPALFDENTFTEYGKEMDGWECRRRRTEGNDWAIMRLGLPGIVDTIEVDTVHFTGNFSPQCSIYGIYYEPSQEPAECDMLIQERAAAVEARGELSKDGRMGLCASEKENALVRALASESWDVLVPLTPLAGGYVGKSKVFFKLAQPKRITHLRLNMGPDGGIARMKVYGVVSRPPGTYTTPTSGEGASGSIDLAYIENGGIALGCSNSHYGHPRNLTNPGRGLVMGDGWETARQPRRPPVYERGADGLMVLPGCDWAVLQLGVPGTVQRLDVDTNHYKGNYPESCLVEGCDINRYSGGKSQSELKSLLCKDINDPTVEWFPLLTRSRLSSSASHIFDLTSDVTNRPVTHIKITIYPDGGVQRLRVYGRPAAEHSRL